MEEKFNKIKKGQNMEQLEKRFSVIIPAYNIEDYIERAIKSVRYQTFKNIEIIVVNDASTDNTEEKIKKLKDKYKELIYIEHENKKGLGGARNTGLKVAKGEYIIFLDGDDYLANANVLEKLDELIGQDKTDVVYMGFKIEGKREELIIPTPETCTKTYKAATDKYPNAWSKCWNRRFLEKNNIYFPEHRLYEDVLFVYKAVMKSKTSKIADFIVHHYIYGRTNSITTKIKLKNIEDTLKNIKELLEIRKNQQTEEIDIIIKKEIYWCKNRLDRFMNTLYS